MEKGNSSLKHLTGDYL